MSKLQAILPERVRELIARPDTIKVLATTDLDGTPHVVFKGSLHVDKDGYLAYYEVIETSVTNKNLVNSIWFHRPVAINILNGSESYQIKGVPYRAIISGARFEEAYKKIQEKKGNIDLSTVWLIEPTEVIDQGFEKRRVEEEIAHPLLRHLDRLVKE